MVGTGAASVDPPADWGAMVPPGCPVADGVPPNGEVTDTVIVPVVEIVGVLVGIRVAVEVEVEIAVGVNVGV